MKAYGAFIKKGIHIYRTEAYIQFGESKNIISTFVMLNPGKAKFVTNTLSENMEVVGEVSLDRTMQAIVELVKKLHGTNEVESIQGQIKIYNLFPLQNAKANDAIDEFEELWFEQEPLVTRLPKDRADLLRELKSSPWVLLGWGCGRSPKALNLIKEQWIDLIAKGLLTYYHPRPHLHSQELDYRNELYEQYKMLSLD